MGLIALFALVWIIYLLEAIFDILVFHDLKILIKCVIMIQMIIMTNKYLCVFEEYAFVVHMVKTCTIDLIPFGGLLILILSFWAIIYKLLNLYYRPKDMENT